MPDTQRQIRTALLLFARGFDRERKEYGLGPVVDRAAHEAMLAHTADVAGRACERADDVDFLVAHAGDVPASEHETGRFEQTGDSFHARFRNALEACFRRGYDRVLVVGGDHPELDVTDLRRALAPEPGEVVIGPATDGGFYLLSLTASQLPLIEGLDWDSDGLFAQIADRVRARGLPLRTLSWRHDIDAPEEAREHLPSLVRLIRRYSGLEIGRSFERKPPRDVVTTPRCRTHSRTNRVRGPPAD